MARVVRIVGDPETYEVLCETETTKILVNCDARVRRDIAILERQLEDLRAQLVTRQSSTDVGGNVIDCP